MEDADPSKCIDILRPRGYPLQDDANLCKSNDIPRGTPYKMIANP
jgi:hypothetical protein